jgi:hypothetical protein
MRAASGFPELIGSPHTQNRRSQLDGEPSPKVRIRAHLCARRHVPRDTIWSAAPTCRPLFEGRAKLPIADFAVRPRVSSCGRPRQRAETSQLRAAR